MRGTTRRWQWGGPAGYNMIRVVLGLVLLTAAALKGYQLSTEPVAQTGLLSSRWVLIVLVEFELLFGLWLVSGLHPRSSWATAVVCFGGFACVSLYKAVSGEASCGCFGKVPVNPWYMLLLDLTAVGLLLWQRPNRERSVVTEGDRRWCLRPAEVGAVWLALGIPAAVFMGAYRAATIDDHGDFFGNGRVVILEPKSWVGKRLPLLKYIDIGARISRGRWMVVLYAHGCPHCREEIPKYEQLAVGSGPPGGARIALVEIPPYDRSGDRLVGRNSPCLRGRLSDVKEWFVASPVELLLVDGVAQRVVQKHGQPQAETAEKRMAYADVSQKGRRGI